MVRFSIRGCGPTLPRRPARAALPRDPPRPDGRHRWLIEGVTDFYADRFARDAGLLPHDAYLRRVNDVLVAYYTSIVLWDPTPEVQQTVTDSVAVPPADVAVVPTKPISS